MLGSVVTGFYAVSGVCQGLDVDAKADMKADARGVMGELDVRILAELFGGREIAEALAPAWNGGVYYAAQRKSAVTEAEKESTASIGLLYSSRWKNADSARTFLRIYSAQIPRKYSGVVP